MSDIGTLQIIIITGGIVLLLAIYYFGRPIHSKNENRNDDYSDYDAEEGSLYETDDPDVVWQHHSENTFDKVVTIYVAARAGSILCGRDIRVAVEKVGLVHGRMGVISSIE